MAGTMSSPQSRTPSQKLAADPAHHVWVAASAGTGKTHVLTDRILRLMLEGSPPDRILALTFTKAAAAEMQNRLVKRLGEWLGYSDARLDAEFEAMGVPPTPQRRRRARALFAEALDVPGGLKVQTLHAFAQGLLASFPLEAGLTPGFRALDERDARQLKQRALSECIAEAQAGGDTAFLADLAELSILKGEGGLMQALSAMIAHSDAMLAFSDASGLPVAVRRWLKVEAGEQPGERLRELLAPGAFDDGRLLTFAETLEQWGWKKAFGQADAIRAWLALGTQARFAQFGDLRTQLFDSADKIRSFRQGEKAVPGIQAMAEDIANDLLRLLDYDRRVTTAELAALALRAGHRIVARYRQLKRAAVAIDYDDMIARTVDLLGPAGMPGYVGWKLDSRFDHVLVDEAQDTNERQWTIIGRLIEDYFDSEAERRRSLFVVGDHKQAIYGFQGTDPAVFESWRARLSPQAAEGGRPIEGVDLDLSFRSGPAVLDVVNGLLRQTDAEKLGMAASPPDHRPHRAEAPGEVVLWPVIAPDEGTDEDTDDGGDTGAEDNSEAADRAMAKWLAARIAGWLQQGGPDRLWLPAKKSWARPGDILILLRKRSWLMGALVGELHRQAVPIAGVDRLLLTEPLAVLDCLALVRFAVQPEDDLTLASLLVSPFFGWDHEAVRALNGGRPGLWAALGRSGDDIAREARSWLSTVLALADTVGPARFLDTILSGPLQGRRCLIARLGAEANDPIDELLQQALLYEQANPPALAGFLNWIEAEGSDVKRDAEAAADQVRLMTIHGSKGLEAPVVVLADSAHQRKARRDGFVAVPVDGQTLPVFHPPAKDSAQAVRDELKKQDVRETQEDLRLLYVGLTRAADHLFIGGSASRKALEKLDEETAEGEPKCWHARLRPVLETLPGVERIATDRGEALRHRAGIWVEPDTHETRLESESAALPLHQMHTGVAPPPPRPARPVTPSGLPDAPAEGPAAEAMRAAARRGSWIHTLFERLPAVPRADRAAQARAWLQRQGAGDEAGPIVAQILAVMDDPDHAALFGPDALAEAPIAGVVEGIAIAGTVDRLLVQPDRVLLVDFKTGLKVPASFAEAPPAHRRQMAAYRAVLAQAFPGHRIDVALLYTSGPNFLLGAEKDMAGLLPLE
ncbi:MAG: double-strand break repair helicase AddA [Sphingomonas sp.]|nr:MAG: double-strand break repair helicase AddA [Sphingomonas sp.]